MRETPNLTAVSDDELLRSLSQVLTQSRRVEADLIAHIAEVDQRRLYAREASPSTQKGSGLELRRPAGPASTE